MAFKYSWQFPVRGYETGFDNTVIPYIYVNYLEESATQASGSYGFTFDWYMARNQFWVVRRLQLRYLAEAQGGDQLAMTTWISDIRRASSSREYDLRRASDDQPILRGRHDWVYVDASVPGQLRPIRVPEEFTRDFTPDAVIPDLDVGLGDPAGVETVEAVPFALMFETWFDEVDAAGHVNNAVYVRWCDHVVTEAIRAAGFPPGRVLPGDVTMRRHGREIEYLRGAHDHTPITLKTTLSGCAGDRALWITDVINRETGETMVRDRLTVSFRDANGMACAIPTGVRLAMAGLTAVQQE